MASLIWSVRTTFDPRGIGVVPLFRRVSGVTKSRAGNRRSIAAVSFCHLSTYQHITGCSFVNPQFFLNPTPKPQHLALKNREIPQNPSFGISPLHSVSIVPATSPAPAPSPPRLSGVSLNESGPASFRSKIGEEFPFSPTDQGRSRTDHGDHFWPGLIARSLSFPKVPDANPLNPARLRFLRPDSRLGRPP